MREIIFSPLTPIKGSFCLQIKFSIDESNRRFKRDPIGDRVKIEELDIASNEYVEETLQLGTGTPLFPRYVEHDNRELRGFWIGHHLYPPDSICPAITYTGPDSDFIVWVAQMHISEVMRVQIKDSMTYREIKEWLSMNMSKNHLYVDNLGNWKRMTEL